MTAVDDSGGFRRAGSIVLWVELTTHVVTQDLHFRSGREEQAVDSIVGLFGTTRKLMEENRGSRRIPRSCRRRCSNASGPYTARWHSMRAMRRARF